MRIYQTGQDIYLSIYLLNMVLPWMNGITMKIMCMQCFGHNLKVRLVSLSMRIRVPAVASLKKNILRFAKSCGRNVFGVRVFCLLTAGGAPIEVIRQYIESQGDKNAEE